MKQIIIAFALVMATVCSAQKVSNKDAEKYAASYIKNIVKSSAIVVGSKAVELNETVVCYVCSLSGNGYVMVSADKRLDPIIGYSLDDSINADSLPDPIVGYLGYFCDDINAFDTNVSESSKWATDTIVSKNKTLKKSVEPLIDVKWNQSGEYRQFCPSNASHGNAIVGCVAVGMAQAMSVYKYPERPVGQHKYNSANYGTLSVNYDEEPAYDWDLILSGEDNKVSCARLLYHCGVSVDMDYDQDGSGVTYMGIVPKAMREYFGYSNKVHNIKMEKYTKEEWEEILMTELSEGRPLIYSGYSKTGGHCFNVDGFNENGLFHFNWGWAGSGNGYFAITSHKYPEGQLCTVDFAPPTCAPLSVDIDNLLIESGLPAGTVVGNIVVDTDKDIVDWEWQYEVKGVKTFLGKKEADPSFYVENNQLKTIKQLDITETKSSYGGTLVVTNPNNGKSIEKEFTVELKPGSGIRDITRDANVSLYSQNGCIYVGPTLSNDIVELYSVNGQLVAKKVTGSSKETRFDNLSKGVYVVRLVDGKNISPQKITVK